MCFAPQRRALFRHLNLQKWSEHGVFCTFWLGNVLRATTACTFSTSQLPKVVRDRQFLTLLTSKCASRHNGVHFFDIATSKSGPTLVCFVHFDLEMCFAPQRRALFWHRNFQKWSDAGVFCTFWLGNVLRATTACTFSTSQLPKVVRTPQFLTHFTSKCASRHNGVQFFISHLASWLRTRRFSEPTFWPSGATNHWKNSVSRLSYLFAHLYLLSSYSFSSDLLSANLPLLSASALLCFSSLHIVGSLTSKLPSILYIYIYTYGSYLFLQSLGEAELRRLLQARRKPRRRTGAALSAPWPRRRPRRSCHTRRRPRRRPRRRSRRLWSPLRRRRRSRTWDPGWERLETSATDMMCFFS